MTIITIGRGPENKIVVDEPEISRLHAMVKVDGRGRLWVIDKSSNGTYINGIKIARDVPVPVSRKDDVSFAKVRHLDWARIPDPAKKIKLGALAALAVIALVVIASIVIPKLKSSPTPTPVNDEAPYTPSVAPAPDNKAKQKPDSAATQKPDSTSKQKSAEGKEDNNAEQKNDDSKSSEAVKADKDASADKADSEKDSPDWAKQIVEKEAAQKRAAEAAKNAPKPSTAAPKSAETTKKPAEPAKKPAEPAKKPAESAKKPADNTKKPSTPTKKTEPAPKQDNTQNRIL